jgi:hypothetical protein
MQTRVLTISRQVGTLGEDVARLVADELGYHLLDYRLVQAAAEQAGVSTETIAESEHKPSFFTRILEALALSRAEGDVPLASLITEEAKRFGRHTTVVVVTSSTSEDWVGALQFLGERGVKVAAVLLEPSTFGGEENSLMVFGALAASDVYTYLVRRSDDLMDAFAMGMEGGGETVGRR